MHNDELYVMLIRLLGNAIFIASKSPKDYFLSFSRIKNIKYSTW